MEHSFFTHQSQRIIDFSVNYLVQNNQLPDLDKYQEWSFKKYNKATSHYFGLKAMRSGTYSMFLPSAVRLKFFSNVPQAFSLASGHNKICCGWRRKLSCWLIGGGAMWVTCVWALALIGAVQAWTSTAGLCSQLAGVHTASFVYCSQSHQDASHSLQTHAHLFTHRVTYHRR